MFGPVSLICGVFSGRTTRSGCAFPEMLGGAIGGAGD